MSTLGHSRAQPEGWLALLCLAGLLAAQPAVAASAAEAGRRLYEQGLLTDGSPLTGIRDDHLISTGEPAACATCHRRSGMGSVEGDIQAPPVTGNALFGTGEKVVATMDPRSGKAFNRAHDPYTDASVAAAIRTGRRVDGTAMNPVMPRYALGEADMRAVLAHLRQLSASWSPGVSADTIRFATVITPDVAPERRAVFTDMVRKIVAQKNGSTKVAGKGTRHHMTSAAELVLGTERRWNLDVWELHGPAATWADQLEQLYARQPVFALLSGLGGDEWGPVEAFCDLRAVPCWFPSVARPASTAPAYSLYFSGGVTLEANALATRLRAAGARAPARVLQVIRDSATGHGAAAALATALGASGTTVEEYVLDSTGADALATRLAGMSDADAVVFWLGDTDVAALASLPPPRAATYFSATLGGAERTPVPPAWRSTAQLLCPYELPGRRAANLAYFNAWLNQRHVPLVDEIMQSEVYFSFAFLTDTIAEMLDNLYRDYLIERAEDMISRREGGRAEAEYYSSTQSHVRTQAQAVSGVSAAPSSEAPGLRAQRLAGSQFGSRAGTSAYPRLTLGPSQRFASKGIYIARFSADGALLADGDWIVP